jgi:hypothetical protein
LLVDSDFVLSFGSGLLFKGVPVVEDVLIVVVEETGCVVGEQACVGVEDTGYAGDFLKVVVDCGLQGFEILMIVIAVGWIP